MLTLTASIIISRNPFNHVLTRRERQLPAALRHHALLLTPTDTTLLATSCRPDQLARIALDAASCWGVPVVGWCRCWACTELLRLQVIRPIQPAALNGQVTR